MSSHCAELVLLVEYVSVCRVCGKSICLVKFYCLLFVWTFQMEMGLAKRAIAVLRVCGTCAFREFTE